MTQIPKPIYLVLITLFLVGIVATVYLITNKPESGVPDVLNNPVANLPDKEFQFESRLQQTQANPTSLPVFTLDSSPLTLEESQTIATNLGFLDPPTTLKDINTGTAYFWFTDNSLRIIPALHLIDYSTSELAEYSQLFPEDEGLFKIAEKFLSEKKLLDTKSLEFTKIRFLKPIVDDLVESTEDTAELADVIFSEKVNGYPVVNTIGNGDSISVKIDRSGQINSAYLDRLQSVSKGAVFPIMDFEELQKSLGKARILKLQGEGLEAELVSATEIKKVIFTQHKIAYLQEPDPGQRQLQPIFVLQALVELLNGTTVPAQFYLPAIDSDLIDR